MGACSALQHNTLFGTVDVDVAVDVDDAQQNMSRLGPVDFMYTWRVLFGVGRVGIWYVTVNSSR